MNNTNNESGAVRIQAGDLRRLDHLRDINLTTDTMDFQKLAGEYKSELLDSVLPFWLEHSQDKQYGGYFTCLERDGSVYDTDKFIWLQGREVWLFSMLYNKVAKRPEWLECALQGAEFLKKYGHDGNYNWYFSLTRDGRLIVYASEAAFTGEPIEDGYFGCAGVAEIPGLQDKLIRLAKGGFKHHTSVAPGHLKEVLKEAMTTYLPYTWVDIDG